jgi:hypothetical protein
MTTTGKLFHVSSNEYQTFASSSTLDPNGLYKEIRGSGLCSPGGLYFFDKLEAAEDFGTYWVSDAEGRIGFTIWEVQLTSQERASLIPDPWFDNEQISPPHEDEDDLHGEFAVYWNDTTNAWAAWHGPTITSVPASRLVEYALSFT